MGKIGGELGLTVYRMYKEAFDLTKPRHKPTRGLREGVSWDFSVGIAAMYCLVQLAAHERLQAW